MEKYLLLLRPFEVAIVGMMIGPKHVQVTREFFCVQNGSCVSYNTMLKWINQFMHGYFGVDAGAHDY